jgi:alpha-1,6-mannosyl-glycoprotein beta-1,2-N-acetylglucosaminyltransferase
VRIGKDEAKKINCLNAADPDTYGNFRDSKFVQIKHHWFWKLSFAFQNLTIASKYENMSVMLLEEDYYLMPDTLDVLYKLIKKFVFFRNLTVR